MDKRKSEKINEALIGIKNGKAECVSELYVEIAPTMRYIALKYVRNDADADDLVQDFWADIYKIASGFFYMSNAFAFLCKVMTRREINRYREMHSGREVSIDFVDYSVIDRDAEFTFEQAETKSAVEKAMTSLTDQEKIVIQETYFEEKTLRAIAHDMKLSVQQVSRLKTDAMEKMKKNFEKMREKSGG